MLHERWYGPAGAALAGALAGAILTTAEVLCAELTAAPLPPSLWLFLAAYYVPAGAVAAAAAAMVPGRRRPWTDAAEGTLAWVLPAVAALYAVAVANQNVLRGQGWSAAWRLPVSAAVVAAVLGAAAWMERTLHGRPVGGVASRCARRLLPFVVFAAALHLAVPALSRLTPPAAAVAVPLAALLATASLAALLLALEARVPGAAPALFVAALAATFGLAGWRAWSASTRARDLPQPSPATSAAAARGLPNVVLIVLDTVRAANLSCYGYGRRTTPHLDALASEGVRYGNATTPGTWSIPAHASLFTGSFPRQHGAGLWEGVAPAALPLAPEALTLAETLSEHGFATAGVSANRLVSSAFGLDQGFRYFDAGRPTGIGSRYHPLLRRVQNWLPRALGGPLRARFARSYPDGRHITGRALAWLAARRPPGQPFFLFVNYMDAHPPRLPRRGYTDRWAASEPPPGGPEAWGDPDDGRDPPTAAHREYLVALYDGAIAYLDEQVGRLLDGLKALPDADRTWIIVTADHGEALGEHGRVGHHCTVQEELLRVPLIMRYPRGMGPPAGTVDEGPVQLVDLAPRVLSGLGLPALPAAAPRPPMAAMLASTDCSCAARHPALHGDVLHALTLDGLKYVEEGGRPPRLFDLRRDPGESSDLRAQRPLEAARLGAELERWLRLLAPLYPPAADPSGNAEREEALRALGYAR